MLNELIWIVPKSRDVLSENFKLPPRARWIATWSIGIGLMLKFQMEAKPVHFLKKIVILRIHGDGFAATLTNFGIAWLHS